MRIGPESELKPLSTLLCGLQQVLQGLGIAPCCAILLLFECVSDGVRHGASQFVFLLLWWLSAR